MPSENDGWDCDFRFSNLPRGRRMEDRARVGVWRGVVLVVMVLDSMKFNIPIAVERGRCNYHRSSF